MEDCKFSYNNLDDSLIISCNYKKELGEKTFEFDDIVFYLTENGKIIGLQIRNVSSVLEGSGLNENILENLNYVNLEIIPKKYSLFIKINLVSNNKKEKSTLGRIFMPNAQSINF